MLDVQFSYVPAIKEMQVWQTCCLRSIVYSNPCVLFCFVFQLVVDILLLVCTFFLVSLHVFYRTL